MVPKHRIPKIVASCIACASTNTSTVMSQPHAAGYHRRHLCNECDTPFYTLARYDRTSFQSQAVPFKDRPLSAWEQQQRLEWAAEAAGETTPLPQGVTFATEFIETINMVFEKQQRGEKLTGAEYGLMSTIHKLEDIWDNGEQNGQRNGFDGEHFHEPEDT